MLSLRFLLVLQERQGSSCLPSMETSLAKSRFLLHRHKPWNFIVSDLNLNLVRKQKILVLKKINLMWSKIKACAIAETQSCKQQPNLFRSQRAPPLTSQLLVRELSVEDPSLPNHLSVFCKSQCFSFSTSKITGRMGSHILQKIQLPYFFKLKNKPLFNTNSSFIIMY